MSRGIDDHRKSKRVTPNPVDYSCAQASISRAAPVLLLSGTRPHSLTELVPRAPRFGTTVAHKGVTLAKTASDVRRRGESTARVQDSSLNGLLSHKSRDSGSNDDDSVFLGLRWISAAFTDSRAVENLHRYLASTVSSESRRD